MQLKYFDKNQSKSLSMPIYGHYTLFGHNSVNFVRFRQSRALKSCIFCQESDPNNFGDHVPMFNKKSLMPIYGHNILLGHNSFNFFRFRQSRTLKSCIFCQESDPDNFVVHVRLFKKSLMPIYGHYILLGHKLVNFVRFRQSKALKSYIFCQQSDHVNNFRDNVPMFKKLLMPIYGHYALLGHNP